MTMPELFAGPNLEIWRSGEAAKKKESCRNKKLLNRTLFNLPDSTNCRRIILFQFLYPDISEPDFRSMSEKSYVTFFPVQSRMLHPIQRVLTCFFQISLKDRGAI